MIIKQIMLLILCTTQISARPTQKSQNLDTTTTTKYINTSITLPEKILPEPPTILIWDLGGVLLDFSYGAYIKHIGKANLIRFLLLDWHNPVSLGQHMQDKTFDVLNNIHLEKPQGFKHSSTTNGTPLPYIISAYQAGIISPDKCLEIALQTLNRLDKHAQYFISQREKEIITRSLEAIFSPTIHAISTYAHPQSLSILKKVSLITNQTGSPKYKQFVLSNWESNTYNKIKYPLLKNHLTCFEDVTISGNIGTVKPNNKTFEIIIKKHNLNKSKCIFIDDQKENIAAAHEYGIGYPLLFKSSQQLYFDLKKLGILK